MRMGYFTGSFGTRMPVEEGLAHCAELGFDGVEICTWPGYPADSARLSDREAGAIGRRATELGLEVCAVGMHYHFLSPEAWEPGRGGPSVAAGIERFARNAALAAMWGAPVVDVLGGRGPDGVPQDEASNVLADALAQCIPAAREHRVLIGFEPHVAQLVDTAAKTRRLIEKVNSPWVGVNLDASHFAVMGEDPVAASRDLAPLSVHTHLKGTDGCYPDHQFLVPGEGTFDLIGWLGALRDGGYDGYITPEVAGMVKEKPGYDPRAAAERTVRAVREGFEGAGIAVG